MISRMAMEDIEALRADGIDVPPREVVRLNALGLRVERGPLTWTAFAAPRVAFLGAVTLREPTLGAEMWLRQLIDSFNCDDAQTYFSLRFLACAVPWRELPDPTDTESVLNAVKSAMERVGDVTVRQVDCALDWCIDGNLPESGENPPSKPSGGTDADVEEEGLPDHFSPEFGLFYRGMAARIGSASDMKDMTYSAMLAVCERAEEIAASSAFGCERGRDDKAEKSRAYGDYMRALDAVRAGASRQHQDGGLAGQKGRPNDKGDERREEQGAGKVPPDGGKVPLEVGDGLSDFGVHVGIIPQETL